MTYSHLLSNMKLVASGLRQRGLKTGDNLVVISGNHIELPLMSMAVWRAGGTQACLSVNLPQGKKSPISFHDDISSNVFNFIYFRCD
jgi:long-subunit acyl-CoA synthetase (AMP-forming)